MTSAVIYTRVSLDRDGTKASPQTQDAECRALCERNGWDVVDVYSDRNLSAFRRGVVRPELERMFLDLAAGRADRLVVYKLDRLTRSGMVGLAGVFTKLEGTSAQLVSVHDNMDTSTPIGQAVAGFLAAQAQQESMNTSIRVTSAHARAAHEGQMHTGGCRQFGYERDGTVVRAEAEVVRELAGRLLDGESLANCARELNGRGVRTSAGKQWYSDTVGQMLRSPRLAGFRTYQGALLPGSWEPILAEGEWTHLRANLDSRANSIGNVRVQAHLMTGLLRCGRCGRNLKGAHFRQANGKLFDRYQCMPQPGMANCGRMAASKTAVDMHMTELWLTIMSSARLRPLAEDDSRDLAAEVADVEARAAKAARDHYVTGPMDEATFRSVHDELVGGLALGSAAYEAGAVAERTEAELQAERDESFSELMLDMEANPEAYEG